MTQRGGQTGQASTALWDSGAKSPAGMRELPDITQRESELEPELQVQDDFPTAPHPAATQILHSPALAGLAWTDAR